MAIGSGTQVGEIRVDLDLRKDKFDRGIRDAHGKMGGLRAGFERSAGASRKFALALGGAATAVIGLIGVGVKIAGDLEAARQGFIALLGSAEKADATMERIKKEAKATPFELPGLVAGTQALTAITKSGDKAIDILLDVGKAIAVSGKGQAELDTAVNLFQKVASTGRFTIRELLQFKRVLPIFGDMVKDAGLTEKALLEAKDPGKELIKIFEKAGKKGGIAAEGFSLQAGTFKQLLSNLKDNFIIAMSDIVKATGAFDAVKNGIGRINQIIEANSDRIIGFIKSFVEIVKNNFPIIAGIIFGGLIPALIALAASIWATIAPLIPFFAIGALIGVLLNKLIQHFGGWRNVVAALQPFLENLKLIAKVIWKEVLKLWGVIKKELVPALRELWKQVGPVLIPVLKVLGAVIGLALVGAILLIVNVIRIFIKILVKLIQWHTNTWNAIKGFIANVKAGWKELPDFLKSIGNAIKNAIIRPFKTAFNWVNNKLNGLKNKIKDTFDFNKRSSPSVNDLLKETTTGVQKAYGKMFGFIEQRADMSKVGLKGALGTTPTPDIQNNSKTVNILGNITLGNKEAVDRFFERLGRSQELSELGVSSNA